MTANSSLGLIRREGRSTNDPGGHTFGFSVEGQEQVLGANIVMAPTSGDRFGGADHGPCSQRRRSNMGLLRPSETLAGLVFGPQPVWKRPRASPISDQE